VGWFFLILFYLNAAFLFTNASLITKNLVENNNNFIDHDQIVIDGEIDLISQSITEDWTGDGTKENPIIIENYNFTEFLFNETGISLKSISSYIIIRNNIFEISLGRAIYLENVSNLKIFNNSLLSADIGILSISSINIDIESNYIQNTRSAIKICGSYNSFVQGNDIKNAKKNGILVNSLSSDIIVESNTIGDITEVGIYIYSANNNFARNNIITNSGWGIAIGNDSSNNSVTKNKVSLADNMGIIIFEYSDSNMISDNIIDLSNIGVDIYNNSKYNIVIGNLVVNNNIGLRLDSSAIGNNIFFNAFKDNNFPQANIANDENYLNNGSHGNFWDDYMGQDTNGDGIGDNPFLIDKENTIYDFFPLFEFNHPGLGIFYIIDSNLTPDPYNFLTSTETDSYFFSLNGADNIFLIVLVLVGIPVVIGVGYYSNQNRKTRNNTNLRNFSQNYYNYRPQENISVYCRECGTKKMLGDIFCAECGIKF
jgi:parallel beta-helix repeat protein